MERGVGIVVTAKMPSAGESKTRLSAVLGRERRAALQAALLHDALAKAKFVGKTYLAFTPAGAIDEALVYTADEAFAQVGADIGERMANAVEQLIARGHTPAIVIGTDCPYLTVADLEEASQCLQKADICLGPAVDGGYYLIGMRHPHRGVFADVPWSSPFMLQKTIGRIAKLGLTYRLIRSLPDVDTPVDLRKLTDCVAGQGPWEVDAPEVRALLRSWHR